ncbi:MAG: tRNA uridine(34) 5-carboxymethylaminomethyl modification radical SAM/GNAT enzyme Elp3 [Candidatus Nanohaloarchaeota archaeon]|nr:tRNA uridine(34) 5-carboxymethylaminomethyl modification radical SAM/GNAT enzyme Elp3 [Candidatus Nanohaloarchaeota archaeon]
MKQETLKKAVRELIHHILYQGSALTPKKLAELKRKIAKKYNLDMLIRNSLILEYASDEEKSYLKELLRVKKVRSVSGVVVIAVMIPPLPCPGECVYCPSSTTAPKSYTGKEPASLRAQMFEFDAFKQVSARLKQLEAIGHETDKVEVIVMGGTFLAQSLKFQYDFIKGIYDALNEHKAKTLEEAIKLNETAKHRCVGLTIETRPDYAQKRHIDLMLKYGATRVELGVQVLNDRVLKKIKRGHSLKDVVESTHLLKDSAYKLAYHIMPGFQTFEQDVKMFKRMFSDQRFRPDMLKIYPVLVIEGTELYEWWKAGIYKPLSNEEAAELIAEAYRYIPEWVRVMRVQRDIPANVIDAGVTKSNLREYVEKVMKEKGIPCREIRCREAGHKWIKEGLLPKNLTFVKRRYKASWGTEYFLSYEDVEQDILVGYLRARIPDKPYRPELNSKTLLVRELKVVGMSLPLHVRKKVSFQHKGIGKELMQKAEELAYDKKMEKVAVISAVGTREYYRKLGYELLGPYMVKDL